MNRGLRLSTIFRLLVADRQRMWLFARQMAASEPSGDSTPENRCRSYARHFSNRCKWVYRISPLPAELCHNLRICSREQLPLLALLGMTIRDLIMVYPR
jgi:hypothetical protein